MGRRKLRFDRHRNYERKMYAVEKLPVSINISDTVMVFRVSLPLRFYSGYTTELLPDVMMLYTRLSTSAVLPAHWLSFHDIEGNKLSLVKLSNSTEQGAESALTVFLSVVVSADLSWSLTVHGQPCAVGVAGDLLRFAPSKLCAVQHVLKVVRLLDQSQLCVGNPDAKYVPLIVHHKGSLKDSSGKLFVHLHHQIKIIIIPC